MERTLADIEAGIASLRADVTKYRQLAEKRAAHGQIMIAQKLLEFVADLETRVAELEVLARSTMMKAPQGTAAPTSAG